MSSPKIFSAILTLALALPLTQSVIFACQIWSGDQAARKMVLDLPTDIPGWRHEANSEFEIKDRDVIRRSYSNAEGDTLIVLSRLTSAYRIHDPIDCARAAGVQPETAGSLSLSARLGDSPLHASLVRTTKDGKKRLGIAWFQTGNLTAATQRDWKVLLIQNGLNLKQPVCRQTYLLLRNRDDAKGEQLLCDAARHVYEEQQ